MFTSPVREAGVYRLRVLRGRERERASIEALVRRARDGHGGGIVLYGEPGIGKSALLRQAAEDAGTARLRVLRTVGVEPEADLPYATLHRLLMPVLDRIGFLPPPQARALRVVFGQADGPAPDRYLVALASLTLLSELAGSEPTLALVDDAHWADRPSLEVLAFVARRLESEPVALLLAARADEGAPVGTQGLIELPLAGLDREAARALIADLTGGALPEAELERLLRATAGNPLAIRELSSAGASGPVDPRAPIALTQGLRSAFLRRVEDRPADARRLLLLIAADGTGRMDVLHRAAAELAAGYPSPSPEDLGDLVDVSGTTVAFRHPLIRSAIYHDADPAARRAAHRALAAALQDDPAESDRRAWHLGQAAEGPDEAAAEELERSAGRTARHLGPAAAAAALARAAELSPPGPDRSRRLAAAASACWHGGDGDRARVLLDQAERDAAESGPVRLDITILRALIELRAGTPAHALTLLRPLIPHALTTDRSRAIDLLTQFGEATFHAGSAQAWDEIGAAVERLPLTGDSTDEVLTRLVRAAARVRAGKPAGVASGDLDTVQRLTDPALLCWAGGMVWGIGDHDRAQWMRHEAMRRARTLGAAGALAWILQYVALTEINASRFATAEAYTEEGLRLADETAQPNLGCWHRAQLAMIAAYRGQEDEARRLAARVLDEAQERTLAGAASMARRALGTLELAAGRPEDALRHYRALDRGDAVHPGIRSATLPDHIEAAVRADRPDEAARWLTPFLNWAEAMNAPDYLALAARCRGLVSTGNPEAHYREALTLHTGADTPIDRARTELLLGEHLRRARRPADSRPHLRAALETFDRLGAVTWVDRARNELRATGASTGERSPDALSGLTPQELRIALALSEGATNREMAAQLFLSPRTIEYHLRKIFQKTGTASRTELTLLILNSK